MKTKLIAVLFVVFPLLAYSQEAREVKLPTPTTQGGMPLMQALNQRQSSREFNEKDLPWEVISELLWAASGINRPQTGQRTAPTAKNTQEIDIYLANAHGLYLYDCKAHALLPVVQGDTRALTGEQPFVRDAPVNLIYVADFAKMNGPSEEAEFYAATDTGFISQNVYLYCASAGLATVVRGWMYKPTLAKAMKLRADQKIILAQTVGYPKE